VFDATALQAIADELNDKVLHGRVQEIVQLDALTFCLEIYSAHQRHYLYVCAHLEDARVHLVSRKLRGSGETPSAFLMLLRKYAEGSFIESAASLPHERVLRITFDHSVEGISTLVVETIGRYSNIILLDTDDVVLDSLKRVSAQVNRARVTLPRHTYAPPPPQDKLALATLEPPKLARALLDQRGQPLWQTLVKTVAGVSPTLAREVAFRTMGHTDAPTGTARAEVVLGTLSLLAHAPWEPSVAYDEDTGDPVDYAPYALLQFRNRRTFGSISAALEEFYGAPESYAAAKEPLRTALSEARDRLARKRDALSKSMPGEGQIELLKTNGELVLAYAYQIKPGQTMLAAESGSGILKIPLDASLSPVENAQKYFKDYHRAKDSAARVPALLQEANAQVEYAEQMLNDLELAENRGEIDAVVQAAREAGLLTEARPRAKAIVSEPRVVQSKDGFTIVVGRNARQNDQVTFRRARPDDVWLHARGVVGAHVVVLRAGREVPESTITEAAALAAHYSQARDESRVDVIVAPRKNVRRLRGGKPGMVTVRDERVVTVVPGNG
jgi:predicted ribosome quality control (RQC) complex YloA/Tae2 family protein